MSLALQPLEWDSRFFALRIGQLSGVPESADDLAGPLAEARARSFDCVYARVPADALDPGVVLERAGFVARDVRLDFACPVGSGSPAADIRSWGESDLAALEDIAEGAFASTRFAADPHFPRDRVRELYRTWVRNSCHGFAQAVLVTGAPGAPTGFVTLHLDEQTRGARIGLIGISAGHRSQGLGMRLVAASLHWAAGHQCREMAVATQANNVGAQRLYQRSGFTTVAASTWYHAWPRLTSTKERTI